jgi:prophage pi1 protein 08|nr:MAG TPA: repressor domain protein [Caudoviricetes sp.]
MSELQIFKNEEFGEIRTVEISGEPWFVGKDVAEALGYSNTKDAISSHVDDEDKQIFQKSENTTFEIPNRGMAIINESGLYSLILSSKLPNAKAFKKWVTSEVLPSIRKHGGYISGQAEMSPEELMAKALQVAQKTLEEREARIGVLAAENSALTVEKQILQPKADYFDELVDRNLLTNFRETAKQLSIKQNDFVNFLLEKKYVYRDKRGKLLPYADRNKGLFEVKECFNEKTQWSGTQTLITPKGRETFRLLYLQV